MIPRRTLDLFRAVPDELHEQYHRGQIFTRLALLGRRDLPDLDLLR